jgi:hypothetical protein
MSQGSLNEFTLCAVSSHDALNAIGHPLQVEESASVKSDFDEN